MDSVDSAHGLTSQQVIDQLNAKWQQPFFGLAKLHFCDWVPWNRWKRLNDLDRVGVYVLSKRNGGVSGYADFLSDAVIYIGKTNEGKTTSLRSRLSQFDRAAFQNGGGHAGGHTYRDKFGADQMGLCVSVCPVYWIRSAHVSDLPSFAVIQVVTRLEVCLRGLYVYSWGRLPICNKE